MSNAKENDYRVRLEDAAKAIRKIFPQKIENAVVLGSGWGAFTQRLKVEAQIPYSEIPGFHATTVVGHSGELVIGQCAGLRLAVMKGRVHFYEGHSMAQVVFPIRVLQQLGVRQVLLTNAAGGLGPNMRPGDFMILSDHLNLFGANPLIGPNHEFLGTRFPDLTQAYDQVLSDVIERAMKKHGARFSKGVYAYNSGPSFETPAEIRAFRTLGADAVGMSTVPETIAARHMGMRVAGISCISNLAAGISPTPLSHEEVSETAKSVEKLFSDVLESVCMEMGSRP